MLSAYAKARQHHRQLLKRCLLFFSVACISLLHLPTVPLTSQLPSLHYRHPKFKLPFAQLQAPGWCSCSRDLDNQWLRRKLFECTTIWAQAGLSRLLSMGVIHEVKFSSLVWDIAGV
ncbi:hypothetical protein HPP92_029082 [Vanilla planifolia]|uniref:Uncharacterized protein n=1 Tax=Vanilla planifolia TaxID=51239 RepID=A0A835P3M8_VANPL|nr:hypothetical protein HPP92_029071 [Vanilla planifolia]KAG0445971.1 hypothetical protein HPP92_029082 [Vanilla planifolia]